MATNTVPNAEEMLALETLLDRVGLFEMLIALSVICGDKADHIRVNWQDERTARAWDEARGRLETTAKTKQIEAVS